MPAALRVVLVIALVAALALAAGNVFSRHDYLWIPVPIGLALLLGYGVFEIRRYRPRDDRATATWQPTDEKFIDPTTGEVTTVYYDSVSGKRDYRASAR